MKAFKTAWNNIRRSPYQAIAAILVMMLTFLVISSLSFILFGSSKIVSYFEGKPQVTAFFKNEAKQSDIDTLKTQLKSNSKVSNIKFVSKQEALKIYQEQNKNDPLLLDLVTADILPSSLEISTVKIEDLSSISEMLKSSSIVEEVIFQKDIVSTLTSWTNALRKIGISIVVVLSFTSIFIMVTIIGVKVAAKREDITIMRLIGATGWYIRWPFIFEGIFYGAMGAVLGWGIASISVWLATPFLSSFLHGIPILPVPIIFLSLLLVAELLLAIFLGSISSFWAVLRYLK